MRRASGSCGCVQYCIGREQRASQEMCSATKKVDGRLERQSAGWVGVQVNQALRLWSSLSNRSIREPVESSRLICLSDATLEAAMDGWTDGWRSGWAMD